MSDSLPILAPPIFQANFGFAAPVCRLAVRLIRGDRTGPVADPGGMRSHTHLGFHVDPYNYGLEPLRCSPSQVQSNLSRTIRSPPT
jgi:hypothetical protein